MSNFVIIIETIQKGFRQAIIFSTLDFFVQIAPNFDMK